jgi:hypothetical protein
MKVLYFVQDTRGGEISFGVTGARRLNKKLSQLQLGNPTQLKLLGVIPATNASKLANELRATFSSAHINGDWYEPVPELATFIRARATVP